MRSVMSLSLLLALAAGAAGCSDFLSGPGVDQDPNNITKLGRPGPLYVGVQTAQAVQFEGQLARQATMYVQQVAGTARQQSGFDLGTFATGDVDAYFTDVYATQPAQAGGGGGLLDIRKVQTLAFAAHDSIYVGVAKVWEALIMGTAASIWGDVPYRQAVRPDSFPTPAFDPQLQVYGDVLAQLDSAITIYLAATPGGTNAGPASGEELIYGGASTADLKTIYTEVAHSLKARYFMHLAELDPSNYARALAEARAGISSPTHDFLWFHTTNPNSQNVWFQFQETRGDISPGAAMINLLKTRIAAGVEDSARLKFYFIAAPDGSGYFGFRPGGNAAEPGGASPTGAHSDFNFINPNPPASAPGDFRQPEITWAETQLIAAEAAFHDGGQGAAQPFLDAVRATRVFGSTGGAAVTFPPLASVPATLQNIMEEKYLNLFLNMEAWNDWKRTCMPFLAPPPPNISSPTPGTVIPGRLPYGLSEINANPHTPSVSPTGRNANDPTPCPVLDYTTTTPRAF